MHAAGTHGSSANDVQVTPLLNELRQGNLVGNLENLTKSASEAASDIHKLQTEVQPFHQGFVFALQLHIVTCQARLSIHSLRECAAAPPIYIAIAAHSPNGNALPLGRLQILSSSQKHPICICPACMPLQIRCLMVGVLLQHDVAGLNR